MSFQCYYQSDPEDKQTRCKNVQEDNWCSDDHRILWQHYTYGVQKEKTSIEKAIEGFKRLQREAREKRFQTQQKLL